MGEPWESRREMPGVEESGVVRLRWMVEQYGKLGQKSELLGLGGWQPRDWPWTVISWMTSCRTGQAKLRRRRWCCKRYLGVGPQALSPPVAACCGRSCAGSTAPQGAGNKVPGSVQRHSCSPPGQKRQAALPRRPPAYHQGRPRMQALARGAGAWSLTAHRPGASVFRPPALCLTRPSGPPGTACPSSAAEAPRSASGRQRRTAPGGELASVSEPHHSKVARPIG